MRVGFELKVYSNSVAEARQAAYEKISAFLNAPAEDVPGMVDMELKVSQVKEKESSHYSDELEVTVYANVKQSVFKPF